MNQTYSLFNISKKFHNNNNRDHKCDNQTKNSKNLFAMLLISLYAFVICFLSDDCNLHLWPPFILDHVFLVLCNFVYFPIVFGKILTDILDKRKLTFLWFCAGSLLSWA